MVKQVSPGTFIERTRCPVCDGTGCNELYRCAFCEEPMLTYLRNFYQWQGSFDPCYLNHGEYVLCQCEKCKLIFQKYVPHDNLLQVLYEQYISPDDELLRTLKSYSQTRFYADVQEISNLLKSIRKPAREARILDYGMGFSRWALVAQAMGCQVFGTELVEHKVKYAKGHGITILSENELEGMDFDLINTEQVFEHLCNPSATLKTIIGGLRKHGAIKISVPRAWFMKKKISKAKWAGDEKDRLRLNPVSPLEHLNCFAGDSLRVLATSAGLRPMRLAYSQLTFSLERKDFKEASLALLGGRAFIKSGLPRGNYCIFQRSPKIA